MKFTHIISLLILLSGITFASYSPGLQGDFVFDDVPNIKANSKLAIDSLTSQQLLKSALSGNSGQTGRPISMLSFGLNTFFNGYDAYYFKLTNLFIHILAGISIFILANLLIAITYPSTIKKQTRWWIGLAISAAWLLHPFNLTSVLYIVQRMNSLVALFTLWGIISYIIGRQRLQTGGKGWSWILASVMLFVPLATLSKENGILLVLYIFIIECVIFKFRTHRQETKKLLYIFYSIILIVPAIFVTGYLLTNPQFILRGYEYRDFTLGERLLTEARVLMWYIKMIVFPNISEMGLFHDDIRASTSLMSPPTTIISFILIIGLFVTALISSKKLPLLALGILWFFAGHILESTILSLELAYEHRNYLPSFGLLFILIFFLLYPMKYLNSLRLRTITAVALLMLFAGTTYLRAAQWGNTPAFIVLQAANHPDSPRSNYYAGSLYGSLIDNGITPADNFTKAKYHFERAIELRPQMASAQIALIYLYSSYEQSVPQSTINKLKNSLKYKKIEASTISALKQLSKCKIANICKVSDNEYMGINQSALDNPLLRGKNRADILSYMASFSGYALNNYKMAVTFITEATHAAPAYITYKTHRVKWLTMNRQFKEAFKEIEKIELLDKYGLSSQYIRDSRKHISFLQNNPDKEVSLTPYTSKK